MEQHNRLIPAKLLKDDKAEVKLLAAAAVVHLSSLTKTATE